METDGMTLKLERIKARVTQRQIAREMGLSRQAITKYEGLPLLPGEKVRQYRIALLKCTDISERVA